MVEKRKERRVLQPVVAKIILGRFETYGAINDLSKEGMGIFCDCVFNEGTALKLEVVIPNHNRTTINGKVIWRREFLDNSKKRQRYGIRLS